MSVVKQNASFSSCTDLQYLSTLGIGGYEDRYKEKLIYRCKFVHKNASKTPFVLLQSDLQKLLYWRDKNDLFFFIANLQGRTRQEKKKSGVCGNNETCI